MMTQSLNPHAFATNKEVTLAPRHWLLRSLLSLPCALVATLALLMMMQGLIQRDYPQVDPQPIYRIPNVTAVEPEIETRFPEMEKPIKPQIHEPPPTLEPIAPETGERSVLVLPNQVELPGSGVKPVLILDSQPLPIVRINPVYPNQASARGIEGYVDVLFDITSIGTTTNIRIVGYSPSSIFNRSVLKAVSGWKYKPAGEGATAVATYNVRERISFVMEKASGV